MSKQTGYRQETDRIQTGYRQETGFKKQIREAIYIARDNE